MTVTTDTYADGADYAVLSTSVLLSMALAYHTAQYRGSLAAERASSDLLLRARPVNNDDMARWIESWNMLLAAQQRQQSLLTLSYIKSTMALFHVQDIALRVLEDTSAAQDLLDFADSPVFDRLGTTLQRDVLDAAKRLGAGGATLDDRLLADRAKNLASPVIKVRTGLSQGADLGTAVDDVTGHVEGVAYNANRAAERIVMENVGWPSFKDGRAMMYRRVTTPGACGWCMIVATRLYPAVPGRGDGVRADWHRGCRCTWRLVDYNDAVKYAQARDANGGGNYYDAARAAGLWTGNDPGSYADFIRENRAFTPTN